MSSCAVRFSAEPDADKDSIAVLFCGRFVARRCRMVGAGGILGLVVLVLFAVEPPAVSETVRGCVAAARASSISSAILRSGSCCGRIAVAVLVAADVVSG